MPAIIWVMFFLCGFFFALIFQAVPTAILCMIKAMMFFIKAMIEEMKQ